MTVDNRVIIITGSGSGLGRSHALELARRGARVVVNDIDPVRSATVLEEIGSTGGVAVACSDDVGTVAGGQAIVDLAVESFGTVDGVVNNAGQLRNNAFGELTEVDVDEVLATHVKGAFNVSQPAYRIMAAKRHGRFVFTSSGAGLWGSHHQSNYGAAKTALYGLSTHLGIEGAAHGILSNVVLPNALTTISSKNGAYPQEWLDQLREGHGKLFPWMTTDRVTPMVVYLLSDQCDRTQSAYTAMAGHYSRVFSAVTSGWGPHDGTVATAEDIEANLDAIEDATTFHRPKDLADEGVWLARRFEGDPEPM